MYTYCLNKYVEGEYEIYLNDSIFCHVSESDFQVFYNMVVKSGNRIMRRV